jgi:hypothetical protein
VQISPASTSPTLTALGREGKSGGWFFRHITTDALQGIAAGKYALDSAAPAERHPREQRLRGQHGPRVRGPTRRLAARSSRRRPTTSSQASLPARGHPGHAGQS